MQNENNNTSNNNLVALINNTNNATPLVDMALTTSSILQHLSQVNDQHRDANEFVSKFHASCVPDVSVVDYMSRLRQYSRCSNGVYVVAFIYVDRIQQHPKITLNSLTAHRLVLTSIMLAAKYVDDHHYNNALFAKLGGVHRDELNSLELEFLFTVAFNLYVSEEEYTRYERELLQHAAWMSARLQAQPQPQPQSQSQQQPAEVVPPVSSSSSCAPSTTPSSSSSSTATTTTTSPASSASPVKPNDNDVIICEDMEQEDECDDYEAEAEAEDEDEDEDAELDVLCDDVVDDAIHPSHTHIHAQKAKVVAFVTAGLSDSVSSQPHQHSHECSPVCSVTSGVSVASPATSAHSCEPVAMY